MPALLHSGASLSALAAAGKLHKVPSGSCLMPFCWRKLRHPKPPFVTGGSQAVRVSATAVRRQKMDFVIAPGALCLLMSTDRMGVPGAGTGTFSQIGRGNLR